MSVSLPEQGGRGRSRSVMADLNLVPYIDLLTCMVSFLLITAVWTQLSMLKTRQHGPGEGAESAVADPFAIVVVVNHDGFVVVEGRQDHKVLPSSGASLDFASLTRELESLKQAHPDKTDVEVAPEDDVAFETMVKTMDAVLTAGFPDVSMKDSAAGS
jgi:biopolymer transport protein TolR